MDSCTTIELPVYLRAFLFTSIYLLRSVTERGTTTVWFQNLIEK